MASLTNQTILSTYQSLLKTSSNGNLTTSLLQISDGLGNNSPLYLSTTLAAVNSNLLVGTTTDSGFKLDVNGTSFLRGQTQISGDLGLNGNRLYFGSLLGNTVIRTISSINLQLLNSSTGAALFLNANGYVQIGQSNVVNWAAFSATGSTIYGTTNTTFFATGNVGINQGTDTGYKLDVNGDFRAINSGIVGNTSAFSGGFAGLMSIRKDLDVTAGGTYRNGQLAIGSASNNGALVLGYSTSGAGTIQAAVLGVAFSPLTIQAYGGNVLIGTTTDIASSILTLQSTTKGFLPPRMTNAQRSAISSPAVGLIVYCTDAVEGLYLYKSTGWTFVI